MRKETEQAIKYILKLDDTISPLMADTAMILFGYIGKPERKRRKKSREPNEDIVKYLCEFLIYAKSKAGDTEFLNSKSITKYCRDKYGNTDGGKVYLLFRERLSSFHFRISKREPHNIYFEYVGKE